MIRQSATSKLNNNQIQVLITGKFGDGYLFNKKSANYKYSTNCIHKEYIAFKKFLLGTLCLSKIYCSLNKGFKQNQIYRLTTISHPEITKLFNESYEDTLNRMDELGLALWIFNDGSLHKTKEFYNLNTQKFSENFNKNVLVPFLKNKFGIKAIPTIERKKDGRIFWYLRIRKFDGAFIISQILKKYNIHCFDYKLISSETILKWSKLQEKLKSTNTDINLLSSRTLSNMLNKISV